jgi:uncharacterized membrane protein YbaN (DUF454 family)
LNHVVRHLWGWVLVIIGIIGLIMPIMPGWIFLIPGLIILSDYFAWARRLTEWAKRKTNWAEEQALEKIRGRGKQDGEHPGPSGAGRDDPGQH